MNQSELAAAFKALGDPTRLAIFTFLQSCGCCTEVDEDGQVYVQNGQTVGEVCCCVLGEKKVPSSMSFHLKELRSAGLVTTQKRGQHVLCAVNSQALEGLKEFFNACGCSCCGPDKDSGKETS